MVALLVLAVLAVLALAIVLLAPRWQRRTSLPAPAAKATSLATIDVAASSTAEAASAVPRPEERPAIGRYRIERVLGKGAMGVVYLGRDTASGTLAAIKTLALSETFAPEELAEARARFFREAETAGRLKHPGIVEIYEAGEVAADASTDAGPRLAYIAMEYLPGGTLQAHTRDGALLPLPVAVEVVARIADALDFAHARQVVHRDIKPANVMFDRASGQAKVADFGIARLTDANLTRTGMVLGTPSYMSPEQLTGKKVDGRSDLFSLGVMLYQLVSGTLPFVGDSMGQLMLRIAREAAPDVRTANPHVACIPDAVVAILGRALQKEVNLRYQTGAEMAQDLRKYLEEAPANGAQLPGKSGT